MNDIEKIEKAEQALKQVINAAIKMGVFNDAESVILAHNSLVLLSTGARESLCPVNREAIS